MAYPDALVRTKNWGTEVLTDADLESQFDLIIAWLNAMADEVDGHKHDGTTNEGPKILASNIGTGVYPAANVAAIANMMNFFYPVGTIYANKTVSTNPGTLLGVGTWEAVEEQVIAGYKSGSTNFGTPGASVGADTTTLTAAQSGVPAHTHSINVYPDPIGGGSGSDLRRGETSGNTGASTPANAAEAHSNIQKTLVCYLWVRTA